MFKPLLIKYVSYKSERTIQIGKLDIEFSGFLNPTIKFENLYISNAHWAGKRPLLSAKNISFTFNALQYITNPLGRFVNITIDESEVNLARTREGLRNWRLLQPDFTGPGKYIVLSIKPKNSELNFVNYAKELNFESKIRANLNSKELPVSIEFSGNYKNIPFKGHFSTGEKLTFQKTNQTFKAKGFVSHGVNQIAIDGKLGDIYINQIIDSEISLSGNAFSLLELLAGKPDKGINNLRMNSHLVKTNNKYEFQNFMMSIGATDIKGHFSYFNDNKIPRLSGVFTSRKIDIENLKRVITEFSKSDLEFNDQALNTNRFKDMQIDLLLKTQKLINLKYVNVSNLNLSINAEKRLFKSKIKTSHFNGGPLSMDASVNLNKELPDFKIVAKATNLGIQHLLNDTNLDNKIIVPLNVDLNLRSKGNTMSNLISNLNGQANIELGRGMISNKLDAKLGLDMGKVFWLALTGDKKITLNCGKLSYQINKGFASSNQLWLNTEQTQINGQSSFDFGNKILKATLNPTPKDPSLFTSTKSIQLSGKFVGENYKFDTSLKKWDKFSNNSSNQECK